MKTNQDQGGFYEENEEDERRRDEERGGRERDREREMKSPRRKEVFINLNCCHQLSSFHPVPHKIFTHEI